MLTGPETFSAAEDFVVVLHASKRATVVGERTGGSTGQPLMIDLPGGVKARVCTIHYTYPDGREFVGVGVIPDVEIHPTAVDIATDRDVILEKAVELLKAGRATAGALAAPAPCSAAAGNAPTPTMDIQSEMEMIHSLWKEKKIDEAMHIMQKRVASQDFGSLEPDICASYFYDLACGASLLGRPGEAVAYLGMAVGSGFKNFSHLQSDADMDPIHKDPGFLVLSEMVRLRSVDYLSILRQHADYASNSQTDLVTFTYQSKQDPDPDALSRNMAVGIYRRKGRRRFAGAQPPALGSHPGPPRCELASPSALECFEPPRCLQKGGPWHQRSHDGHHPQRGVSRLGLQGPTHHLPPSGQEGTRLPRHNRGVAKGSTEVGLPGTPLSMHISQTCKETCFQFQRCVPA